MRPPVDYRANWGALAELGVLGLPVGEALGGIGGSALDVSDALRVLSRGLVLEPLVESAVIAGAVLRRRPGAQAVVASAIAGEALTILVGGRVDDALRCVEQDDALKIFGTARVVPGAAQADFWLVACTGDDGVVRVLRVPAHGGSERIDTYRMMDGREASDIVFDAAPVSRDALWLAGAEAEAALAEAAAQAVSAYCADAAGVMGCLVTWTRDYLRTREQFGARIGTFQALQHRLADMHIAALEARAIAREMARAVDAGDGAERIRWLRFAAPAVLSRCGERVGHEAIQLHGGMGVTDELVISHANSRLVVLNRLLARWATLPADLERASNDAGVRHV
jgi:alkylation response protein AidB-like acyl-CoA dehydrogenase